MASRRRQRMAERVPNDVARQIDLHTPDMEERIVAKRLSVALKGRRPDWYRGTRLHDLARQTHWAVPQIERALDVLEALGYGRRADDRRRCDRDHGSRLHERLDKVVGKLPRALALRYPTSDDRHRSGRNDSGPKGDIWGEVSHSFTARDGHLAFQAAAFGLWHQRAAPGETFVDVTRGEMAYLLRAARRPTQRSGGGDISWISQIARDLDAEKLIADVRPNRDGEASEQHKIPCSAIARVDAKIDGRFYRLRDFEREAAGRAASGRTGQTDTLRIYFAEWALDELRHTDRRPVFIVFGVWRSLSGSGRRLYAFLQARHASDDGAGNRVRDFHLSERLRYTLGLRSERQDRAEAIVRHQLADLYHSDARYNRPLEQAPSGFRQVVQPGTSGRRRFVVYAHTGVASRPIDRRKRATPRRPTSMRRRELPHPLILPGDVAEHELDADEVRRYGVAHARIRAAERLTVRIAASRSVRDARDLSKLPVRPYLELVDEGVPVTPELVRTHDRRGPPADDPEHAPPDVGQASF